jgi:nitrogen regulatory protein P-II 1
MKQVIAIVKPYLAEKILEGLRLAPLEAIEVCEVKGMGRQKSYLDQYTESEYSQAFLPKVQITAWVDDSRSEEVISRLMEIARTGRMGDGKIFLLSAASHETVLAESGT